MGNRKYTALPHEYLEEMSSLSDEEYGRLIRALQTYSIYGKELDSTGNERFFLKRVMNREDRYRQELEQLQERRSKAGKLGAQKRWNPEGSSTEDDAQEKTEDTQEDMAEDMAKLSKNGNTNPNPNPNPNPDPVPTPSAIASGVGAGGDCASAEAEEAAPAALLWRGSEEAAHAASPWVEGEEATAPFPGRELVEDAASAATPWKELDKAVRSRLGLKLSASAKKELRGYLKPLGLELCLYAVDRAADEKKDNWSYLRGILRSLRKQGVKTPEEACAMPRSFGNKGASPPKEGFQRHGQVTLTPLEREAVLRALEDDLEF